MPASIDQPRAARRIDLAAWTLFVGLAAALLAGDLVLKSWSFKHVAGVAVPLTAANAKDPHLIPPHESLSIIPHVLSLKLTLNFGAVFGIGQGGRTVFVVISCIAVVAVVMIFWRSRRGPRLVQIGLALFLAGAIGNLYDRVRFDGGVRDMLYLFEGVRLPFGWSWPGGSREVYPWIFNLADAALCVGVLLILLVMLRKPRAKTSQSDQKPLDS